MHSTATPLFALDLNNGAHRRHFAVERVPNLGWHVLEESETEVIRQTTVSDWHRVELAIRAFRVEAAALTRSGWRAS